MTISKKLKISLLAVSMISFTQMPMIACAQLNDSESYDGSLFDRDDIGGSFTGGGIYGNDTRYQ